MRAYFLDSGYLIALEDESDQYHQEAVRHWNALSKKLPLLVTTSYIFNEVTTFFNCHGYHSKAVSIGEKLLESSYIQFIHVDEVLFNEGWGYFKKYPDKTYSFTDCISFALMKKLDIQTALGFDRHFIQADFNLLPSQE